MGVGVHPRNAQRKPGTPRTAHPKRNTPLACSEAARTICGNGLLILPHEALKGAAPSDAETGLRWVRSSRIKILSESPPCLFCCVCIFLFFLLRNEIEKMSWRASNSYSA